MKIVLTICLFFTAATIGFAQSNKMIEKANLKVEKLNNLIISENPEFALTEDQKMQIQKLHIQKFIDVRKINKSDASEEEKKAQKKQIYKKVNAIIRKEILTKDQKVARRTAIKKLKGK
jgi:hypothetical protein